METLRTATTLLETFYGKDSPYSRGWLWRPRTYGTTALYGEQPQRRLTFRPDRPHANTMYARATSHPTPQGIVVPLASIRWKQHRTRPFFGHSYTAPTPHEFLLQKMGLCFTKAFH